MNIKDNTISDIFKALGHPIRLCIVEGLLKNKCNVNHIVECLKIRQATISQHLTVLKAAGIIKGEKNGTQICYSVCNPVVEKIIKAL